MADWTTISSLATSGGTLVLAVATFAAVRSSNRSARIAEMTLQEQRRPVLMPSRIDDAEQKIMFIEQRWLAVGGGAAEAVHENCVVYLAMSLRNVGSGIGVLQAWAVRPRLMSAREEHAPDDDYRAQTRDLYVPAGDIGVWQGALRNESDPEREEVVRAIDERAPIAVELLYSDQVGGQRTITRFAMIPSGAAQWVTSASRHWYLDWAGPR